MELVKDIGEILQDTIFKEQYKCGRDWEIRENKLLLKSSNLYDIWRRYKGINNTGDYNTKREFVVQLRRLAFAIRNTGGTARIGGKLVTAICFDLEKMKAEKDISIQLLPEILMSIDTSEFI